jgi:hypothetical protein
MFMWHPRRTGVFYIGPDGQFVSEKPAPPGTMQPEVGAVMEEGETEAETAKNQYQVSPKNLYPVSSSAEDRKSDGGICTRSHPKRGGPEIR